MFRAFFNSIPMIVIAFLVEGRAEILTFVGHLDFTLYKLPNYLVIKYTADGKNCQII